MSTSNTNTHSHFAPEAMSVRSIHNGIVSLHVRIQTMNTMENTQNMRFRLITLWRAGSAVNGN